MNRLFHEPCFSGIKICTLSFWEGRIKVLLETELWIHDSALYLGMCCQTYFEV